MVRDIKLVPGKLMLAGEFAVTKPGHKGIVMAIDRFADEDSSQFIDADSGLKYGFGSSAAHLVYKERLAHPSFKDKQIFEAVLKKSREQNPNNSGADVAASVYGGVLVYGDDQVIEKLEIPESWKLLVGWTKKPAITSNIVENTKISDDYLINSDWIIEDMIAAIKNDDWDAFNNSIRDARMNMNKLPGVATPDLNNLIEIAKKSGISAKISGAGGGDNGIAFTKELENKKLVEEKWLENGIQPLDISIYYRRKQIKK